MANLLETVEPGEAIVDGGYEAARSGAALAALPGAVLAVTGPQRQKFLHDILSNEVAARTAGQGTPAALLDAKGHVQCLMRVLVGSDTVWLEVPADRLDEVERPARALPRGRARALRAPAAGRPRPAGAGRAETLFRAGADVAAPAPERARLRRTGRDRRARSPASDLPAGGIALHLPAEAAGAVRAALGERGASAIGEDALDTLRVEDGDPWYGPDVTEANLLHETGLVARYHSPTKGCYVGQESHRAPGSARRPRQQVAARPAADRAGRRGRRHHVRRDGRRTRHDRRGVAAPRTHRHGVTSTAAAPIPAPSSRSAARRRRSRCCPWRR